MKQLQNNFTTPDQSKQLLELGVPADSADCFYSHYIKTYAHSEYTEILWHRPRFITEDNIPNWNARQMDGTQTYLPCWSVGRLIEIYDICRYYDGDYDEVYGKETYIETFISAIEEAILDDMLDFSKLEE